MKPCRKRHIDGGNILTLQEIFIARDSIASEALRERLCLLTLPAGDRGKHTPLRCEYRRNHRTLGKARAAHYSKF